MQVGRFDTLLLFGGDGGGVDKTVAISATLISRGAIMVFHSSAPALLLLLCIRLPGPSLHRTPAKFLGLLLLLMMMLTVDWDSFLSSSGVPPCHVDS